MPDTLATTLRALEQDLIDPAVRRDRAQLERLLTEDFLEFGSSGRVFNREAIIAELLSEPSPPTPRAIEQFRIVSETADQVLVAYRSSGPAPDRSGADAVFLRSSLWIRQSETWRMRFHQGTRCPAAE